MLGTERRAKTRDDQRERTNRASFGQTLSRGRIAGLALIAVLTLGLGYLHFAGRSTAVSVCAGAHAGQLAMHPCPVRREGRLRRGLRDAGGPETAMIRTRG